MPHVAVAAVGADRPGIVAAVTEVLMQQGCNLEDTSMTILRGQFAMMLVVAAPEALSPAALEVALAPAAATFDLIVTVRQVDERTAAAAFAGDLWTVSVYGADRPGIVHGVAALLAGAGVNIVDLTTRVVGAAEHPAYVMVLELQVPEGVDATALGRQLTARAGELGVDCSLHPSDADIL